MSSPDGRPLHSVHLLGVRLDCVDETEILERMRASLRGDAVPLTVTYAHFDTLLLAGRSPELRQALARADVVFPDGIALHLVLRLLLGAPAARFSSPDLNERAIAQAAALGARLLCVGGTPAVSVALPSVLTRLGAADGTAVTADGWTSRDDAAWDALIAGAQPGMIVLGMGGLPQNLLLEPLRTRSRARVVFAVGACFDLLTAATVRPPRWMWRAGMEWLARLIQEPRRLWRRYLLGFPRFLALVLLEQLRRR